MNIGLYQSASALSALERWQEAVAQNITSSETNGYRKRTINISTTTAGEIQADPRAKIGSDSTFQTLFPKVNTGVNYGGGQTQPTKRDLDVAIQGDGFFEVQMPDGSRAYTRNGEFHLRQDRTLVGAGGAEVLTDSGAPITLLQNGKSLVVNRDGTLFQGDVALGRLSIQRFANNAALVPTSGGFFIPGAGGQPEPVAEPDLLQGYLESSNVTPLREMVDLVLISRAYEANQKIITTIDQQMEKTLQALG
ncbi:flagellar hook-basal body protein [Opitutus sp. ER46]|uniref:flagellar hook-basal body protein n=1 Tax=Opitutus sp. ER46 TaxID=2161864 RepID=UPI000D31AFE9|nr:flagellar hook-basal body protein [Opitutus sp. ER46]PTX90920.1 flagellar hook-basal body protein [Opitutus sp. ER46]